MGFLGAREEEDEEEEEEVRVSGQRKKEKEKGDDDDADRERKRNSTFLTFASSRTTPRSDSSPTESARSENDLPLAREVTARPARLFCILELGRKGMKRH